jgi:hypothetical protein
MLSITGDDSGIIWTVVIVIAIIYCWCVPITWRQRCKVSEKYGAKVNLKVGHYKSYNSFKQVTILIIILTGVSISVNNFSEHHICGKFQDIDWENIQIKQSSTST